MTSKKDPVKLGPFVNGMNTYSDNTSITDTEAVSIINMEIDLDGSLKSRAPIRRITDGHGTSMSRLLTMYISKTGVAYCIFYRVGSTTLEAYDASANAWTTISNNINVGAVVQYANKLWIIATPDSPNNGGSWDPTTGYTAVAAIPRGCSAVVYKERLFVATGAGTDNSARMNFSNAANLTTWTGTDFLDVNNGDGQPIVAIYQFSGSIVIFKTNSVYTVGYESIPANGIVKPISLAVGISNAFSCIEYEDVMYFMDGSKLYSLNNWNINQINLKVPFEYYSFRGKTTDINISLSIVDDRLVCRYYDNLYIYGLKTRAFSLWRCNLSGYTPSRFLEFPYVDDTTRLPIYFSGNYANDETYNYKFISVFNDEDEESIKCELETKTYDFQTAYTFKRLAFWGVDTLTKTIVDFTIKQFVFAIPATWGQVSSYTWSSLYTWEQPTIPPNVFITDQSSLSNQAGKRSFIKILKSLRFRQIGFKIETTTDGTNATSPFRIFSLTAFISNRQLVSRKVS